jgi:hypothetical protein
MWVQTLASLHPLNSSQNSTDMGNLRNLRNFLLALFTVAFCQVGYSQGLEGIIVETFYIADANDASDIDGGSIANGATTYRIYVDMAPGYEIQAVYGNAAHTLRIATSTEFFNNEDRGAITGHGIALNRWDDNTVALDSYLTLSAVTATTVGVLKTDDTNGAVQNADGFVQSANPLAGIPVSTADGMIPGTTASALVTVGLDASMFDNVNSAVDFISNGGAWSVLEGVVGPTADNRVLVAQITTDGQLEFELNVQLGSPSGGTEQYVASNATGAEQLFAGLTYPAAAVSGCMDNTACNYNAAATTDDGSCIVPVANCSACNATNDGLVIVDTDGDGVCDADEVPGCTSATACNYNSLATDENGSCIEPVANCSTCSGGVLVAIDTDGDGVCDADEVPGCTNSSACNYNSLATDDNGSCIVPVANCSACNATNDGLVAIDTDGDGVCDADEVLGCTSSTACNYNSLATDDNGSCIQPVANCSTCSGGVLVIVDTDGDGICNADEIAGCTDPLASNYNPAATDDNGSCTFGAVNACDGVAGGLEDLIVETWYVADANDAADTDGGTLAPGSVTYRIYADLAPGYEIQAVYGNAAHTLSIATTTEFFNNEDRGAVSGDGIALNRWDDNTVALDSYLTLGAVTATTLGVLKTEDTNGAVANSAGLLLNTDAAAGIPVSVADGMIPGTTASGLVTVGLNTSMFDNVNSSQAFVSNGGAWSVLEGVTGPTAANRVLIAQITTDGDLSFALNIQLGTPTGGVEQYVSSNASGAERYCSQLIYPGIPGCLDVAACNYNSGATFDDGSCILPVANCSACNATNDGLVAIDADGDGVCNADEYAGCTSPTACNYDALVDAGNDNGSCIEPVANCQACNATNTGLVIVDTDGDGICNADEVAGCTNSAACNYNALATDENGSCIVPVANCSACNATNDGLVIIDADGDGVCNALEVAGCTSATACNYNALATDEDGSCVEPVVGCSQCSGTSLVIVDADGDGICDLDEVAGCTNALACNYDALATDDNGSCIVPVPNCQVCNATNDGLVIVDTDGDGTCDADENPGCNNPLACNYDPAATGDDGSCLVPVANCSECDELQNGTFVLISIDADGDGVCNADEIVGCTNTDACNYNPLATDHDPVLCIEAIPGCYACDFAAGTLVIIDTDGDGVCDGEEVLGCTSATACNYNAAATEDNGTCFEPVAGCYVCGPNGSVVLIDTDGDGICNSEEVPGCTSTEACNYNPLATDDNGSCIEPIGNCYICNATNDGLIIVDTDGDGICNAYEIAGCTSATACNYNPAATDDNGSCLEPTEDCLECYFVAMHWILVTIDTDGDGICDADEIDGCTNAAACNYNAAATDDNGSCIVPVANCSACNATNTGLVIVDTDGDGVCNANEIPGCTSTTACNYNPAATDDNGSCLEPVADCLLCFFDGMHWQLVLADTDGDGVCNADDFCYGNDATGDADGDGICADEEIFGCTDAAACNYNPAATEDDWSCILPVANCVACNATNTGLVLIDTDGDGICNANEVPGCTNVAACNYNPLATDENGSCIVPVANCSACNATNTGLVIVDTDGDGVCDANEVFGCTNAAACNYNPLATEDNWSCLVPVPNCLVCNATNTGLILIDTDGDGICNANEVPGCTSISACNYNPAATDNDGSCLQPVAGCSECNPITQTLVIIDTDGDGICNAQEVPGCTNAAACNYNAAATDDNGSCIVPVPNCTQCYTTQSGLTFLVQIDADGDGICNANEVAGCTNPGASNYNPAATDDDGSCITLCLSAPSCESFELGLNGWTQVASDDINWTLNSGATPSFYTGPDAAYEGSEYIYIEASYPNYPNKNAQLVSPCYDLVSASSITFAYHMQGVYDAVGSLSVDISTDGGASFTSIWSAAGHQGTTWNTDVIDLAAFTGQSVKFRLSGTTANSWKGDIAVDDFCLVQNVYGCTDENAVNYDPTATINDGSCSTFSCIGTVTVPYCEGFEAGFGLWSNSAADDFNWTNLSGPTASWGTGPDAAVEGNYYIYAEASHPNYPFKQAIINTPCFDLTGTVAPKISFDYHMFGTFVGSIYLQASTNGVNWTYLWWETGSQADAWLSADVDLSAYAGQTVQLRFIGQTAHGWQGDLAIDGVCVEEAPVPMPAIGLTHNDIERIHNHFTKVYDGVTPLQADEFAQTTVSIYPNPVNAGGAVRIDVADISADVEFITVIVRDIVGKEIAASRYNVNDGAVNDYLSLPYDIANGTYIVTVQSGATMSTEKLVITK